MFIDKLLNTKNSTKRVHPPTLNKLSKMLDDINGLDEKNAQLVERINNSIKRLLRRPK